MVKYKACLSTTGFTHWVCIKIQNNINEINPLIVFHLFLFFDFCKTTEHEGKLEINNTNKLTK